MASVKPCAACTFNNPLTATVCEVCNTPFAASTTAERWPTTGEEWVAAQRQDAAHQEAIQETYKVLAQLERNQAAEAATKAMLEQEAAAAAGGGGGGGAVEGARNMQTGSLASQNASFRSRDPRLARLVQRMQRELPDRLRNLKANGRKTGHWVWWAWPTEKEGFSEPTPKTAVTRDNAGELIERAPPEWRQVLEKVCELVEGREKGFNGVLPSNDWNRIRFFVDFWNTVPESPPWLKDRVIPCLREALAKSYGGDGGKTRRGGGKTRRGRGRGKTRRGKGKGRGKGKTRRRIR